MIENVKIKVMLHDKVKKAIEVPKGSTLLEISKSFQEEYSYPILLASVNGVYRELNYRIEEDSLLLFFDLTSRVGSRTHIAGLTFLLLKAVQDLYGKKSNIYIEHSIDKGIYVKTNFSLTEQKVKEIKEAMHQLVKKNLEIKKMTVERLDAIRYFEQIGDFPKAKTMNYNTNTYITLYRLENIYNYFYHYMPVETSLLKDFDLTFIHEKGLVLQFPTVYQTEEITKYKHHPLLFQVFEEASDFGKKLEIETLADLNEIVSKGKVGELIRMDETLQNNRLLEIAREIVHQKRKVKIILLAGPSSSGKTTTTKKLCMYLQSLGYHPKMLSMDNYFVERKENPKLPTGEYDYETFQALDVALLDEQIEKLFNGEEVLIPTYNFFTGKKEFKETLKLEEKDILLMEGIHALNAELLKNIPRSSKYKIYLSALTELKIDNHNRFSTTDNRLLRRMIRDNRTRGYSVEQTLASWPNVRNGEEINIFPYQDEADVVFNTELIYELGVLKTYGEPLLYSVKETSPYYEEAKRLLNLMHLILPISSEQIPDDSILREFVGGSYFDAK